MRRGLILTSCPDEAQGDPVRWLVAQLAAAQADLLKIVPAWGMAWTPRRIASVAHLAPTLIVRTTWGDPSIDGSARRLPKAAEILAEVRPWLAVRPDALIEIGNEPLLTPWPNDDGAWEYRWYLDQTITTLRSAFPRAKLLAPAHLRNHLIALGAYTDGQGRWDTICRDVLRRCDGLTLHAYSPEQAADGVRQLRQVVGDLPIWCTEFALNEDLAPTARGRRYRSVLDALPLAGVALYHLDAQGGSDPVHFNPRYRLDPPTLAAFGAAPVPPLPPAPTRPPITNVAMTREHLTRGRAHGPIQLLVLHATAGKAPGDLDWLRKGGDPRRPVSCQYYIDKAGRITQLVADHDTAWHAGRSRWHGLEILHRNADGSTTPSVNAISLGIELENLNTGHDPYPEAQYAAAVALARYLVHLHQITRANLVRHLDISPGRKTDPAGFPWARFVAAVFPEAP